jgi:hypothetical protein
MADKSIECRNATAGDLPGILEVEKSWPEASRAGADKFRARLARFPQGFFVACVDGRIVASITAMALRYDAQALHGFDSWAALTNDGYLFDTAQPDANAVYIVSGVVDKDYRTLNIFDPMVLAEVALARRLGLRYVLAGAVLPGYKKHLEEHGPVDAWGYCSARRGSRLVDPLLAMYERIGFTVPDARHVVAGYYPDDASRNHAALVVRDLGAGAL